MAEKHACENISNFGQWSFKDISNLSFGVYLIKRSITVLCTFERVHYEKHLFKNILIFGFWLRGRCRIFLF